MTLRAKIIVAGLLVQAFWPQLQAERQDRWRVIESPALKGVSANRLFFANDRLGWICSDLNRILKTIDGGMHWAVLKTNLETPDTTVAGLWFEDEQRGWAVGGVQQEPTIWRTKDGGRSWIVNRSWPRAWAESTGALLDIRFADSDRGWAVGFNGSNSVIVGTTDGGEHWDTQYSGAEFAGQFSRVHFRNARLGWALSPDAVMQTIDGGQTWQLRLLGSALLSNIDPDLSESQGAWVAGTWGHVLHTRNGIAWSKIRMPRRFRNHFFSGVKFINSKYGWISGAQCEIMITRDGGRSWRQEACPLKRGEKLKVTTGELVATSSMLYILADSGLLLMRVLNDSNSLR